MILGAVVEAVALELQNGDSGMGRQQAGMPTVKLSKSVGPNNQIVPNTHVCMSTKIIHVAQTQYNTILYIVVT